MTPPEGQEAINRMDATTVVTGGAGFIGSHLVEQLVEEGRRVRVIERPGAATDHLPPEAEVVFVDIRDREALGDGLRGAHHVYHLAANPNLWAADRKSFDAVNHQGTVNVLDAAIAAGASRIVHTSTESILTCSHSKGEIGEEVEVTEADAVGPYCLSKLRAEQAAMARAKAGHPVLIANPTMPVGPGDRGLSPPTRLIRDFLQGRLPAYMDCTLNLVDVRDVVLGLRRVLQLGYPGRRYLLGGENLTLRALLRVLSDLTGQPVPRWRVPYPVGLAIAYASEWWADLVSQSPPRATVTGVRLTRRTMHFDEGRSRRELGLSPRPVRQSIQDAVFWLQNASRDPSPPDLILPAGRHARA
jgi:dihydroflavonol-4-reductase